MDEDEGHEEALPSKPRKSGRGCGCGCLMILMAGVGGAVAFDAMLSRGGQRVAVVETTGEIPGMMPEVAAFLGEHPEFGRPVGVRNLVEWERGKRQRVDFPGGRSLAFYEMGGKIITVWDRTGGDVIVWGKGYEPERPALPLGEHPETGERPME